MKREPEFSYHEEEGITFCKYTDRFGRVHNGMAICSDEDRDVQSDFTGYSVAEYKAKIEYAKARKIDMINRSEALRDLYYSMKHSTKFNPKSYEGRRIKKHYMMSLADVEEAKSTYNELIIGLHKYIESKDKIANSYREKLKKDANLDKDEKI